MSTSDPIKLPRARLSFPHLFEPKAFRQGQEPRFEASFLLDPSDKAHAKVIKQIKSTAKELAEEKWGKKLPRGLKFGFGDGDDKDYDGYEGQFYITTANKTRPTVVDRDRTPLAASDGRPYAGCYVNGSITLWAQNNEYGQRINANLRAVQFVADGEAFGVKPVDAEEEFNDLSDDDDGQENFLD